MQLIVGAKKSSMRSGCSLSWKTTKRTIAVDPESKAHKQDRLADRMGGASAGRVTKKRSKSRAVSRGAQPPMHRGSRSSGSNVTKTNNIKAIFERFKEQNGDKIGPEGMLEFFKALKVDPLNIVTLIFAWKLKAKVPFEFSRAEFVDGCLCLNCDTMEKLKRTIPTLEKELNSQPDFRKFYMFSFDYNKPPEQRSMPIETAKQLFPLILKGRFTHLDLWLEFLEGRKHAISRDSYSLLLDFAETISDDMSNFDEENGAWPVLLDEFVDFARPKLGIEKMVEETRDDDDDDNDDDDY